MAISKDLRYLKVYFLNFFCKDVVIFNEKYKELSCICPDSDVYVVQNIFNKKSKTRIKEFYVFRRTKRYLQINEFI